MQVMEYDPATGRMMLTTFDVDDLDEEELCPSSAAERASPSATASVSQGAFSIEASTGSSEPVTLTVPQVVDAEPQEDTLDEMLAGAFQPNVITVDDDEEYDPFSTVPENKESTKSLDPWEAMVQIDFLLVGEHTGFF